MDSLITEKINSKKKNAARDKEWNFIMIKGSVYQGGITIINICVPNIRVLEYMKQKLTEMTGKIYN